MTPEFIKITISFIVGAVVGGAVIWLTLAKNSAQRKLQDELTSSKRKLADTYRAMDDFFKNTSLLLAQLDRHYHNFSDFMRDASNKFSIKDTESYIDENMIAAEVEDYSEEPTQELSAPPAGSADANAATKDIMPLQDHENLSQDVEQAEQTQNDDAQNPEAIQEVPEPASVGVESQEVPSSAQTPAQEAPTVPSDAVDEDLEIIPRQSGEEDKVELPELTETSDIFASPTAVKDQSNAAYDDSGTESKQPEKI